MNVEELRETCLALPGTSESFPYAKFPAGGEVLVFKVAGKVFCMSDLAALPARFSIKCTPQDALRWDLEERRGWCAVPLDGDMPLASLRQLVENSYRIVVAALPRRLREQYMPPR